MKIPFFRSLRFRMPVVVLLGVIPPMILAILYASARASIIIRSEAKENLALKVNILAESLSSWQENYALALKNLSQQPDIVSMNPQRQKKVLAEWNKTYSIQNNRNSNNKDLYVTITNLKGYNTARSDNNYFQNKYFGDRLWFQGAVAGKELTYQSIVSRVTKKPTLGMSVPIRSKKSRIIGVAALFSNLETLGRQIGAVRFGQSGYAFVVDAQGNVLAHPDGIISGNGKLTNLSQYPPVAHLLQGKSGYFSFSTEKNRNSEWLSFSTTLSNGWGVIVLQEKTEALQKVGELQNVTLSIVIVAALGVIGLTWAIADRLILPISDLTDVASKISQGKLYQKANVDRADELGVLASVFNQMAKQLQDYFRFLEDTNQELENRVYERTAQLEQAKESAEVANSTKGQFLASMSHELRTPLNSILGYAKILQKDRNLNTHQIDELKIIQQSGIYLLTLINDILEFSKMGAQKTDLIPQEIHLVSFLEEVVGIIRLRANEKQLHFYFESVGNLPLGIYADDKRLRQILLNLLSNAVKFTDRGQVILRVTDLGYTTESASEVKLRFEIIDTGIGIDLEDLPKIFQPFEQLGNPEYRSGGTGLGLAIAKQLVELMKSELKIKTIKNKGSIFWFDVNFPVLETASSPVQATTEVLSYQGEARKLLIVDDRQENRLVLFNLLEPLGFEIITADNGQQGFDLAIESKPDLILTDLFMRVKTGFTMVRELRSIAELEDLPIIAISANYFEAVQQEALEAGCNEFLAKPIDEQKLLNLLQQHLKLEWIYEDNSFEQISSLQLNLDPSKDNNN